MIIAISCGSSHGGARFRTFFPDAYKLHYPNAKTHLSSKVRSTLPDGTSLFEKTRSKKRRPFTAEEDEALKLGYEKYGTVWSTIVKDPIFQEQKRRSTDLRDRFRNAFPALYQAAGYKPRSAPKKKRADPIGRKAMDDQSISHRTVGPYRRRRSRTASGYSHSLPQSSACSEDEESSDEDEMPEVSRTMPPVKEMTPQPEAQMTSEDVLNEVDMHTIDQLDELPFSDFLPDTSHAASDSTTDQSIWSLDHRSPNAFDSWSSAATTTTVSPTSSHLSVTDYFNDSTFGRRDGLTMIGKSAWGTSDWLSANPRLGIEPSATPGSSSSHADADSNVGGPSPPPGSPFSLSHLGHGIMDRYDLFQNNAVAHEVASEVGPSDAYSTFSDPDLFPTQSMRGFTHHSNYAGDLIFGARTHQPVQPTPLTSFEGLGLSGMQTDQQQLSVNPMQLHTPGLPGIDELAAIRLDDDEPLVQSHPPTRTTAEIGVQKNDSDMALFGGTSNVDISSLIHLPPQTVDEIIGLTSGLGADIDVDLGVAHDDNADIDPDADGNATPPATPAQNRRVSRELQSSSSGYSSHSRSMSVPPFERMACKDQDHQANSANSHGHATPQLASFRSLSLFDVPHAQQDQEMSNSSQSSMGIGPSSSFFPQATGVDVNTSSTFLNDVSLKSLDLSDLLFLDLRAPEPPMFDLLDQAIDHGRTGTALDLAKSSTPGPTNMQSLTSASYAIANGNVASSSSFASAAAPTARSTNFGTRSPSSSIFDVDTIGRSAGASLHQRVQSQTAVSPKDLFLNYDSRSKRASWDGGVV